MLKLKNWQQYLVAAIAAVTLLLIGLAVLGISLWSANQQTAGIKVIF
jgi:hypothetical protein